MSKMPKKKHPAESHKLWGTYRRLILASHDIVNYSQQSHYKALSNNLLIRANKLLNLMHRDIINSAQLPPLKIDPKVREDMKNALESLKSPKKDEKIWE